MLALTLLLLFWPEPKPQEKQAKPNVVSFQGTDSVQQIKPETKPTFRQQTSPVTTETSLDDTSEEPEDQELTYLDVYRKTRLFSSCRNEIYRWIRDPNQDPLNALQSKLKRLAGPNQLVAQPTPSQIEAVTKHQTKCVLLLDEINRRDTTETVMEDFNVDEVFQQKRDQLQQWLDQTKPKTSKEHAIADTLRLRQEWENSFALVLTASVGDDSQHKDTIAILESQANQLQVEMDVILDELKQTDDKSDLQDNLGDLSQQFNQIQDEIKALNWVDPERRAQTINTFNTFNDPLFKQLSHLDPDVFYETQMTLEKNPRMAYFGHHPYKDIGRYRTKMPFIEYVSPGDVVMQVLELQDPEIFRLVIQHATQLYLCELGEDCGPGSVWVNYYCFQSYNQIDPKSCGLDLTSYLQNHRLSPNHWQDVMWVLDTLRGLYAQ